MGKSPKNQIGSHFRISFCLSAVSIQPILCSNRVGSGQIAPGWFLNWGPWIGLFVICQIRRVRQRYWSTFFFTGRNDRVDLTVRNAGGIHGPCSACFSHIELLHGLARVLKTAGMVGKNLCRRQDLQTAQSGGSATFCRAANASAPTKLTYDLFQVNLFFISR